MNRFYLKKLIVAGGQHQSSVIEFNRGFNLIIGPSNTGKSFIMDCLDYALGATPSKRHPSKVLDANNGYELISLELITQGGYVTLNRKIGDSKIEVISADSSIENGRYSVSNQAKKNINSVFLSLLGIDSNHKILSSEKGDTQKTILADHATFFLLRQPDIARETSPLITPGWNAPTPSIATLLFLLTSKDANNLQKQEDLAISKAKKKALLAYIQEKLDDLSKQRAELEKTVSQCEIVDNQNVIKDLNRKYNERFFNLNNRNVAGYDVANKVWFFDENIVDYNDYLRYARFTPEQLKYLRHFSTNLTNLFQEIDSKIDFQNFNIRYKFEGDVYSVYKSDTTTVIYLTDSVKGTEKLRVVYYKPFHDDLENTRILVTGSLSIYKGHGEIQLLADAIYVTRKKIQVSATN